MRKLKRVLLGAAAAVALLALLGAGLFAWLSGSGLPTRTGRHRLAGLDAAVTVRWDRWGVPHARAESETDLAAALGWLHANDRMTQMELGRRAAYGRLAEVFGEPGYEIDVYFRTLRLGRLAEALAERASPRSRDRLAAYAAGVNAWLEARGADLPPGMRLLGMEPEPWTGAHSLAFALLMARDLSFWNERPEEERFLWLRHFGTTGVRELLGDPEVHIPEAIVDWATGDRQPLFEEDRREVAGSPDSGAPGSNNWALGGSRTASGKAILANDPHLGLHLPAVWYQVHLRAPGFEVAGMSLPGTPGVILGRGPHLAWAFTNVMLDDHDVFFEVLDAEEKRYLRGHEWKPIEEETETIRLSGGETRELVLRATDRGPLLDADPARGLPPRSLRWTAFEGGDPVAALYDLSQASTVDEVLEAIVPFTCPAQNLVVAFESGDLLYTILGRVPARRKGDGRMPSPAADPAYGWDGLLPPESLPRIVAPADDLLVTANNDIHPPAYPLRLTADFYPDFRARRIREELIGRESWSREDVAALQTDVVSLRARELRALLGDGFDGDAERARAALAAWDGAMEVRGPAALFVLLERELRRRVFADEAESAGLALFGSGDRLMRLLRGEMRETWFDDVTTAETESRHEVVAAALSAAWREGAGRWGDDVGTWDHGRLHRLYLRHRLDAAPLLGSWLRRGPFPMPGSSTTIAAFGARWRGDHQEVTFGPSMRWIVDWGDPDRAYAALPGGQSGHPSDVHYDDQIEPFLRGELHEAPWTDDAIAVATVSETSLVP